MMATTALAGPKIEMEHLVAVVDVVATEEAVVADEATIDNLAVDPDASSVAKKAISLVNVPTRLNKAIQSATNVVRPVTFHVNAPKVEPINVSNVERKATFPEVVLKVEAVIVLIVTAKATFQETVPRKGR